MPRILLALLFAGLLPVVAEAVGPVAGPQKCELSWVAPTTNVDGSPLTDLTSYDLFLSKVKGQFVTPFANLTVAVPAPGPNTKIVYDCRAIGLTPDQYWYTVRPVDAAGNRGPNGQPSASAVTDGATQADGVPFFFDPTSPAAVSGLSISP